MYGSGVNSSGNSFNVTVPVPWPLPGGLHTLYGVGETSKLLGQARVPSGSPTGD